MNKEITPENIKAIQTMQQRLLAPFKEQDLEVRANGYGAGKVQALFYITPRAVDKRLRQVFGLGNYSINTLAPALESDFRIQKNATPVEFNKTKQTTKTKGLSPVDPSMAIDSEEATTETETTSSKWLTEGLLVVATVEISVNHPLFSCSFSNVGERGLDEPGHNKATTSWAQAYKRAASLLGIGSYLYYMDSMKAALGEDKKPNIDLTSGDVTDNIHSALADAGFKFECEVYPEEEVDVWTAAKSMDIFGMVLCKKAAREKFEALKKK